MDNGGDDVMRTTTSIGDITIELDVHNCAVESDVSAYIPLYNYYCNYTLSLD